MFAGLNRFSIYKNMERRMMPEFQNRQFRDQLVQVLRPYPIPIDCSMKFPHTQCYVSRVKN